MAGESQDIPIEFAGQAYTLRFGVKAVLALKRRWDCEEAEVQARIGAAAGLEDGIAIIWAGLRTHHPETTEAMVEGWLDDGGVEGIEAAQEAFLNAQPPAPPGPPKAGQRSRARR